MGNQEKMTKLIMRYYMWMLYKARHDPMTGGVKSTMTTVDLDFLNM